MAQANIANLIVPEVFDPYFMELTAEKVRMLAPMTANDARIGNKFRNEGSRLIQLPFFKDLDGDDIGLSVGAEIPTERIESSQDRAVRHMRGKGWTTNDLESELTAEDPANAIASRVAGYWARRIQEFLFFSLDGVFEDNADNDSSDLIESTDGNAADELDMNRKILAVAKNNLGDSGDTLSILSVHSDVYTDLQIKDVIRDERDSEANLEFETFAGYRIVVDDGHPVETDGITDADTATHDAYTSYLFAPDSVAYADNFADVPSELERDAAFSETALFTRIHFLMHPRGFAWQDNSVAGETPTPAETQAAANWDRVYEKKNVRIVKIVTAATELE